MDRLPGEPVTPGSRTSRENGYRRYTQVRLSILNENLDRLASAATKSGATLSWMLNTILSATLTETETSLEGNKWKSIEAPISQSSRAISPLSTES
jgi:hypothetical protein